MAIKIEFDPANNPEQPTFILAKKNGEKLGKLDSKRIHLKDSLKNPCEISFEIYKFLNNQETELWDEIVDFKLLWCVEWNKWFEIKVEVNEQSPDYIIKSVMCVELAQAELSQIMLYNTEINTENDINREDYDVNNPTILYNPGIPSSSLLHRITEKAPHYSFSYVDASIANIQKTFTFDNISIYDAFKQIEEEIGCLFVFDNCDDENGVIKRSIAVYDLEANCLECGYRGSFSDCCPECGSTNITEGYGEDTTIFLTSDMLVGDVKFTTDTDATKNCFKLEGGDDLMTATIRNCNPNGTDYIWHISNDMQREMSNELVQKISEYNALYNNYQNNYRYVIHAGLANDFNNLIVKYQDCVEHEYPLIPKGALNIYSILGYSDLMALYYNAIDLSVFLKSEMMPNVPINMSDTTASEQLALLTTSNLSPVAVTDLQNMSLATANNVVLNYAKIIVDSRYKVEINSSSLANNVWSGSFIVTSYSDSLDTATGVNTVSVTINDNYKIFVEQKLKKTLYSKETKDLSIVGLFNESLVNFETELTKYCLDSLLSFENACQACIDILIEQGISTASTWASAENNLYNEIYMPYYSKLRAIQAEIKVRENEIKIIEYNIDNNVNSSLLNYLVNSINNTHNQLNFENYIGNSLWNEFILFRREDKYSNSNYISDGLDNAELIKRARQFIEIAQRELYKSAELQHSINSSLKNFLFIQRTNALLNYFSVGNWLRIRVNDEVYKLRLLEYEIDFDELGNCSVDFSDVVKTKYGLSDQQSIIANAARMSTSYGYVQKQAIKGEKSNNVIENWFANGLSATNTKIIGGAENQSQVWDDHGILLRRYNAVLDSYDDIQMKIINSTLAITDDDWFTSKAAIGLFKYADPISGELRDGYGINGQTIVGQILLGENLGIYNTSNTLIFDKNGLKISNNRNSITINPNDNSLMCIKKGLTNLLEFDNNGNLNITGTITATSGSIGNWSINSYGNLYYRPQENGNSVIANGNMWLMPAGSNVSYTVGGTTRTGWTIIAGTDFGVTNDGALYATNANITGSITATSLKLDTPSARNTIRTAVSDDIETAKLEVASTVATTYVTNNNFNSFITDTAITKGNIVEYSNPNLLRNTDNPISTEYVVKRNAFIEPEHTRKDNRILSGSYAEPYSSCFYVPNHLSSVTSDADKSFIYTSEMSVSGNTTYTLSFVYRFSGIMTNRTVRIVWREFDSSDNGTSTVHPISNEDYQDSQWHTGTWTFTTLPTSVRGYFRFEGIGETISSSACNLRINNIKCEAGSYATPYTRYDINPAKVYAPNLTISERKYNSNNEEYITITTTDSLGQTKTYNAFTDGLLLSENAVIKGTIIATNGVFTGSLQSPTGSIGNWTIGDLGTIYTNTLYSVSGDYATILWSHTNSSYVRFGVKRALSNDPTLTETQKWNNTNAPWVFSVNGKGELTATAGTIGSLTLDNGALTKSSNYSFTGSVATALSSQNFTTKMTLAAGVGGTYNLDNETQTINAFTDIYSSGLKFEQDSEIQSVISPFGVSSNKMSTATIYLNTSNVHNLLIPELGNPSYIQATYSGLTISARAGLSSGSGYLYGTWYLNSSTAITSDRNKKNNISRNIEQYSSLFDNLKPVSYKYNEGTSNRTHIGFIAQDVEDALELANISTQDFAGLVVSENKDEETDTTTTNYYLRYEEFIALNTYEIQKLKQRVAELEEIIGTINTKMNN